MGCLLICLKLFDVVGIEKIDDTINTIGYALEKSSIIDIAFYLSSLCTEIHSFSNKSMKLCQGGRGFYCVLCTFPLCAWISRLPRTCVKLSYRV